MRNAAACKALLKACGSDGCARAERSGAKEDPQHDGGFYSHSDVSAKSCRQNGASPVPHCQAAFPGFVSGNAEKEECAEFCPSYCRIQFKVFIVRLIVRH